MGVIQYTAEMFPLKTLVIFFILHSRYSSDGKLEIRKTGYHIETLLGHNTTLPCLFYGYEETPLDLSTVSVRWTLRTSEGERRVYLFNGGDRIQYRPGSHIPESGLMGGDVSLYISNIQPSDDGEYTCFVIVTPEKAIGKVTMWVSAVPTCTVSDSRLEMYSDTERSVTCYVSGFYPQPLTIHWETYSKVSSNNSGLDERTCNSIPVQNPNGTCKVMSVLTMKPISTKEDGDVYSCVITHRSLRDPLTCNVTLSVIVPNDHTAAWAFGGFFLAIGLICIAALIYYHCKTESPTISEISKSDLIHMKENILTCSISDFRPKDLTVKLYLEKGTNNEREVIE
ncbi:natural cytotoxicity triggering receptor 3 ligand 1-like, partial [Dendropsophus ebraccatus]|uniref:natural cytotoxicity triggering receptor 3 ligand 1-like n=1 Tax=Dendropsophus ebraccatus TaxID=150705 RepID=UPI00383211E6